MGVKEFQIENKNCHICEVKTIKIPNFIHFTKFETFETKLLGPEPFYQQTMDLIFCLDCLGPSTGWDFSSFWNHGPKTVFTLGRACFVCSQKRTGGKWLAMGYKQSLKWFFESYICLPCFHKSAGEEFFR